VVGEGGEWPERVKEERESQSGADIKLSISKSPLGSLNRLYGI